MLDVVRGVSWIVMVMAVCGCFLGLYCVSGENEYTSYLEQPGVIDVWCGQSIYLQQSPAQDRLVSAVMGISLRLNPPVKADPIKVKSEDNKNVPLREKTIVKNTQNEQSLEVTGPEMVKPKFELMGTVVYTDFPEKSLALIKMSNGKLQWFQKGQRLGYHQLGDIQNGSTRVTINGKTTQLFVPKKPKGQQILKDRKM